MKYEFELPATKQGGYIKSELLPILIGCGIFTMVCYILEVSVA